MARIPEPVQNLVDAFSRLPGIGPRTASRLTFYLLKNNEAVALQLADALENLHPRTHLCRECFNITTADKELCDVCADEKRDQDVICVVESPMDVIVLINLASPFRCLITALELAFSSFSKVTGPTTPS